MKLSSCLRCTAKVAITVVILIFSIQYWLEKKMYIFSDKSVAAIASKYVEREDSDPTQPFAKILKEFRHNYPGHILGDSDIQWIFVNAGGWMGSMCVIHASLTEYVVFFGTAIETSGHSGRYWANISDTILTGEMRQWKEGTHKVHIFKPGALVLHKTGEATGVSFAAGTWMVEYGRGFIPSTLGFALSDTLFSTQDYLTVYYVFRVYAKALFQEFVFMLVSLREYVKDSL